MIESLKDDALQVLAVYDKMLAYRIQEEVLQYLVKIYPNHSIKEAVETKVKLLNLFYSTGIQAVNVAAQQILSIESIDVRLKKGERTLVNEIAKVNLSNNKTRNNYSFATKYCAYHKPRLYPIYDSVVAKVFIRLFEKGLLPKYKYSRRHSVEPNTFTKKEFAEKLKDYKFFCYIYVYFRKEYDLRGLTFRQIDSYLWGAFKIAGANFRIKELADIDTTKITQYVID